MFPGEVMLRSSDGDEILVVNRIRKHEYKNSTKRQSPQRRTYKVNTKAPEITILIECRVEQAHKLGGQNIMDHSGIVNML